MKTLDSLLNSIPIIARSGKDHPLTVKGLAYHSGKVAPGYLFVAIKGYRTDGHRYLPEAARRGALAAVVEELQPQLPLPQFQVADSRRALAALADTFYDHPSQLMVIGLTASNGKTTTAFMTNAVLMKKPLLGTVIMKIGNRIRPAQLITESLDLQVTFTVWSKSSRLGDRGSPAGLSHRVRVYLSSHKQHQPEHIDFHGPLTPIFRPRPPWS